MLSDTVTLFRLKEFDPSNPFDEEFDPDDPFGEGQEEDPPEEELPEEEEGELEVIYNVRISRSSGDRAVDAQGDKSARQAILFYFFGKSKGPSDFKAGDKIVEGVVSELGERFWTVKGVNLIKSKNRMSHLEVSLV